MRLTDWQLAFEQHLLAQTPDANSGFAATLLGGPTLDVDTGLAIYHNAYIARLQEVLRHDFSAILYWLGDDEFAALTHAYVRRYPSAHYSLRWFGERLPAFIHEHLVAEQSAPLAELAKLEWAFTLAFDAPQGQPLSLNDMALLPPGGLYQRLGEAFGGLCLGIVLLLGLLSRHRAGRARRWEKLRRWPGPARVYNLRRPALPTAAGSAFRPLRRRRHPWRSGSLCHRSRFPDP